MTPLHIVLMVCPLMASSPEQCMLGYEDINTSYPTLAECEARAKEVHETMGEDLFRRGASLKISCVDKKIIEKIQQMSLSRQTFSASKKVIK